MNTFNFDKHNTVLSIDESIASFALNGSNNKIYLNAKIPNLLINGHNNKIISQQNSRLLSNVIFNGSNNLVYSQNTNFSKVVNGFNNKINDQLLNGMSFGANNLNFFNNFDGSSFNININNNNAFRNLGPSIESFVNMVTNMAPNVYYGQNNNINFSTSSNYQNDDDEDMSEEEEEEVEEEYEDNEDNNGSVDEEMEMRELMKRRHEIILNFDEFQFKHANKYIKKERIEDSCAICLDKFISTDIVKRFACQEHIFHKKCLATWLKKSNACPLCKYDLMEGIKGEDINQPNNQ